jgi:hypothetical protein
MPRKKKEKTFQITGDTGVDTALEDYDESDEFEDDEPEAPIIQKLKPTKQHVEQYSITEELLRLNRTIPKTAQGSVLSWNQCDDVSVIKQLDA